jgi:uncharacterized protein involved in exopolysaccharide biosynthesis
MMPAAPIPRRYRLMGALVAAWRMLAVAAFMGAAIGAAVAVIPPRRYISIASFMPQRPTQPESSLGQLVSQLGVGIAALVRPAETPQFYSDLLRTREIVRDVVLTTYAPASGATPLTLLSFYGVRGRDSAETVQAAIKRLMKDLTVRTSRTSGIITLEVSQSDPGVALGVVRRFLELVNDYNLRRQQSQARAEREFLERRLATVRGELDSAEAALTSFLMRNRSYMEAPLLMAAQARLQRRVTLAEEVYASLAQSYERSRIEEVRNTPVITVIETPEHFVLRKPRYTVLKTAMGLLTALLGAGALVVVLADLRSTPTALAWAERLRYLGGPADGQ